MDLESQFQASLFENKTGATDWRRDVPTVSQLTRRVRGLVEGNFPEVWVKGEISGFRRPASGHAYFVLKDATAQLRAVLFRPSLMRVKFAIQDGMEVLLHGKLSVYEARGEYQLIADTMEPVGVGALQLAFEQLKAKLQKEGLFEAARKKPMPFLARRIGLVTSPTGAAVRDLLKVLGRRFPNLDVVIFPCLVQGASAAADICGALAKAERWNAERPERALDLLIVGRGGGSLEDLWCFNEEAVARALARCPIPTISAVGHEIDFTIADFVADLRAPTPSAAAEIAVRARAELESLIEHQQTKLRILVLRRLEQLKLHLDHLTRRLVDPRARLRQLRERFMRLEAQLLSTMHHRIRFNRQSVVSFSQRLVDPRVRIRLLRVQITRVGAQIASSMTHRLRLSRQGLVGLMHRLDALSPLQVLTRGYSITQSESGHVLRSSQEAVPDTLLVTRFKDGSVRSRVL